MSTAGAGDGFVVASSRPIEKHLRGWVKARSGMMRAADRADKARVRRVATLYLRRWVGATAAAGPEREAREEAAAAFRAEKDGALVVRVLGAWRDLAHHPVLSTRAVARAGREREERAREDLRRALGGGEGRIPPEMVRERVRNDAVAYMRRRVAVRMMGRVVAVWRKEARRGRGRRKGWKKEEGEGEEGENEFAVPVLNRVAMQVREEEAVKRWAMGRWKRATLVEAEVERRRRRAELEAVRVAFGGWWEETRRRRGLKLAVVQRWMALGSWNKMVAFRMWRLWVLRRRQITLPQTVLLEAFARRRARSVVSAAFRAWASIVPSRVQSRYLEEDYLLLRKENAALRANLELALDASSVASSSLASAHGCIAEYEARLMDAEETIIQLRVALATQESQQPSQSGGGGGGGEMKSRSGGGMLLIPGSTSVPALGPQTRTVGVQTSTGQTPRRRLRTQIRNMSVALSSAEMEQVIRRVDWEEDEFSGYGSEYSYYSVSDEEEYTYRSYTTGGESSMSSVVQARFKENMKKMLEEKEAAAVMSPIRSQTVIIVPATPTTASRQPRKSRTISRLAIHSASDSESSLGPRPRPRAVPTIRTPVAPVREVSYISSRAGSSGAGSSGESFSFLSSSPESWSSSSTGEGEGGGGGGGWRGENKKNM